MVGLSGLHQIKEQMGYARAKATLEVPGSFTAQEEERGRVAVLCEPEVVSPLLWRSTLACPLGGLIPHLGTSLQQFYALL